MRGLEVCRIIKRDFPSTLVLQTSASFVEVADRVRGLDSGADAYLSQPVEPSELLATIRALLRLKRAEQAAEQSNELYRMIVQSVVDHAIITVDQNGLIQSWSEGAHRVLGWAEVGNVNIFSNSPVTKLDDLKAVKMWIWEGDPIAEATFAAMKIKPIPLSITDVMTSLQTGMINAVYSAPATVIPLQWYTKMRNMLSLPIATASGAVVISRKSFRS